MGCRSPGILMENSKTPNSREARGLIRQLVGRYNTCLRCNRRNKVAATHVIRVAIRPIPCIAPSTCGSKLGAAISHFPFHLSSASHTSSSSAILRIDTRQAQSFLDSPRDQARWRIATVGSIDEGQRAVLSSRGRLAQAGCERRDQFGVLVRRGRAAPGNPFADDLARSKQRVGAEQSNFELTRKAMAHEGCFVP